MPYVIQLSAYRTHDRTVRRGTGVRFHLHISSPELSCRHTHSSLSGPAPPQPRTAGGPRRGRTSSDRRSTAPPAMYCLNVLTTVRYMYYVEPSPALMHPLRLANRPVHGGEEARLRVDGVRAFLSAKSASSICLHVFRRTFSDCYAERADSRRRRDSWIVVRISSRFSIQHHRIGQPLAHTLLRPLPCEAHSRSADVSCVEEVVMKVDND